MTGESRIEWQPVDWTNAFFSFDPTDLFAWTKPPIFPEVMTLEFAEQFGRRVYEFRLSIDKIQVTTMGAQIISERVVGNALTARYVWEPLPADPTLYTRTSIRACAFDGATCVKLK